MTRLTKTVSLDHPVVWFDKKIAEIVIVEPTAADLFDLGVTHTFARHPDGVEYSVENTGVIKAYLDRCLKVENGSAILGLLSLNDGLRVKGTLFSFFIRPAAPENSNNASASSHSS